MGITSRPFTKQGALSTICGITLGAPGYLCSLLKMYSNLFSKLLKFSHLNK